MSVSFELNSRGLLSAARKVGFNRFRKAIGIGTFLLAVLIALGSYRYVLGIPPIPDGIAANHFRAPWLVLHAGSASTALLLGAIQFNAVSRLSGIPAHRVVGRIYVVSCLVGSLSGLVLAVGSSAGIIATLGFGSLAVAWAFTNVAGWKNAVCGRIVAHRRWMIRSWALTLSAVTLRLYLLFSGMAGLPEEPSYVAISFLCWVPNLLMAEWTLRAGWPVFDYRVVIGSRSANIIGYRSNSIVSPDNPISSTEILNDSSASPRL